MLMLRAYVALSIFESRKNRRPNSSASLGSMRQQSYIDVRRGKKCQEVTWGGISCPSLYASACKHAGLSGAWASQK